jgi:site-specific DNA-methyltransferase (adenine-specific)
MILCDLPYGTTDCSWDTVIPFEPLWAQYKRLIKDRGAIVLTACQPFASMLVMSNLSWFKYEWIWVKNQPVGHLVAKWRPMQASESVLVFGDGAVDYKPMLTLRTDVAVRGKEGKRTEIMGGKTNLDKNVIRTYTHRHPTNMLYFDVVPRGTNEHPTQKPVELFKYLIRTYTNQGDLVLDNCAGSGTTAVACLETKRRYCVIEQEAKYIDVIRRRVAHWKANEQMELIPDER